MGWVTKELWKSEGSGETTTFPWTNLMVRAGPQGSQLRSTGCASSNRRTPPPRSMWEGGKAIHIIIHTQIDRLRPR